MLTMARKSVALSTRVTEKKQKSQEITVLTAVRVKVKFAMKAKRGSRDIVLLFL